MEAAARSERWSEMRRTRREFERVRARYFRVSRGLTCGGGCDMTGRVRMEVGEDIVEIAGRCRVGCGGRK